MSPTVQLKPQVFVDETLTTNPDTTWQGVWLKDDTDTPVAYLKLRLGDVRDYQGTYLYGGVTLCDIEINPTLRGTHASLAILRVIKAQYQVDRIWVGDTFGKSGYHMMQRLLEHERVTGEQTLAYEPHINPKAVREGHEDYAFVHDWASMQTLYDL